jgi:hypothetical protein
MNQNLFEKIMSKGVQASSTDNMQNWEIFPNKTYTSFILKIKSNSDDFVDWKSKASQISAGCFLENIKITAKYNQYNTKIKINKTDNPLEIGTVEFEKIKDNSKTHTNKIIYKQIENRNCNRTPYKNKQLPNNFYQDMENMMTQKETNLSKSNKTYSNIIVIKKENKDFKNLVNNINECEKTRFFIKKLNKEFYNELRFSKQETNQKRDGLDYKLLGLPSIGEKFILNFLKRWKFLTFLNKLHIGTLISNITCKSLFKHSSGMIIITQKENTKENNIKSGMTFQRVWLELTKYNGTLQPFGPLPFFSYMIKTGEKSRFNKTQEEIISTNENQFKQTLNLQENDNVCLIARYGIQTRQKTHSIRKDIQDFIK